LCKIESPLLARYGTILPFSRQLQQPPALPGPEALLLPVPVRGGQLPRGRRASLAPPGFAATPQAATTRRMSLPSVLTGAARFSTIPVTSVSVPITAQAPPPAEAPLRTQAVPETETAPKTSGAKKPEIEALEARIKELESRIKELESKHSESASGIG